MITHSTYDPDAIADSWVSAGWCYSSEGVRRVVADAIRQTAERCAAIATDHWDKYNCGKLCGANINQDCTDSVADEIRLAFQLNEKPPGWSRSEPPAPAPDPAER